jgi:hypothetical protein
MIGHASSPTDMANRHSKIEYCQQFSVDFLVSSRNIASKAEDGSISKQRIGSWRTQPKQHIFPVLGFPVLAFYSVT